TADRASFADTKMLDTFVKGLDVIIHLAGVNRAKDEELREGNTTLAKQLVDALRNNNSSAYVLYASSTYAKTANNAYGQGKADAGNILQQWVNHSKGRLLKLIIPHVFGEYGKPFYNSAIATFCHQITLGEKINVNPEGELELLHVQALVEQFMLVIEQKREGEQRIVGQQISVIDAANQLHTLYKEYRVKNRLPDISDPLTRNLFNTLRSAIPSSQRLITPVKHTDERGWLLETVKASSGGQCFVSTTKAGITRGNHFHRRKVERFFILQGTAQVQLRKLFSNDIITYNINGDTPSYVDIPTLYTHSVTNIGEVDLITLFWADEFYDPKDPDTYYEEVLLKTSTSTSTSMMP
ncbi:MAG: hypothetical protein KAG20_06700, partial [Cocleimonas sp.]|nr:hypothetical protein [Cocleimonas sp.]